MRRQILPHLRSRASRPAAAAGLVLAGGAAAALASGTVDGLLMSTPVTAATPRDGDDVDSHALRTGRIDIEVDRLVTTDVGDEVDLQLLDDLDVIGLVQQRREPGFGRVTLSGTVLDQPMASFVISINDGIVTAVIRLGPGGTYQIRPDVDGGHRVEQIDVAEVPTCDHVEPSPLGGGVAGGGENDCEDGSFIDLLVLFTAPAREEAGGLAVLEGLIDLMVEDANVAFANSDIQTELRLLFTWEVVVEESSLNITTLIQPNDGVLDEAHQLRDAYGADLVAVVRSGAGGVANGLSSLDPSNELFAFSISGLQSSVNMVLAHEVGHNLGACHAIGDGGGCPEGGGLLFPFSNGHRFFGDSGTLWRTVMAYNPGDRVTYYSDPEIMIDGQPTGVPEDQPDPADNAQTIDAASLLVSNYRCHDDRCVDLALPSFGPDCNQNGVPDACDLAIGLAPDVDGDGRIDDCECGADVTGDGVVDNDDLLALLASWGQGGVVTDANHDGVVDVDDLITVLADWGSCPLVPQVPPPA